MKKILLCGISIFIILTFCGCFGKECEHVFSEATCQSPSVCSLCGETLANKSPHKFKNHICTVCGKLTRTAGELKQYVKENKRTLVTSVTDITDSYEYTSKSAIRAKGDKIHIQITLENYNNASPASDQSLQDCANLVLLSLEEEALTIKESIVEFKSIHCRFYDKNKNLLFSAQTGKLTAAEKYVAKNKEKLDSLKNTLTSSADINYTAEIVADGNSIAVNIVLSDLTDLSGTPTETIHSMKQSFQPQLDSLLAILRSEVLDAENVICNFFDKNRQPV